MDVEKARLKSNIDLEVYTNFDFISYILICSVLTPVLTLVVPLLEATKVFLVREPLYHT